MSITRQFWVVLHRWAGLTLVLFLTVAGFTGIFLAWLDELEVASAPELHLAAPPWRGAMLLEPLEIRRQVLARHPGAWIDFLPLNVEPGRSFKVHVHWRDPKTGEEMANAPEWDDLFINPYTGRELGQRQWGNIGQGIKNLMPFLYRLHYSFAIDGWGQLAFGIAALVWTLDCFVGFYLTLPVRHQQGRGVAPADLNGLGERWRRWRPSWMVRWGSTSYKLNFDLHRAGGLWIWPLLLAFAWSSVSFNLPQVYVPVMKQFGAEDPRALFVTAILDRPREHPAISFNAAQQRAEALAQAEAGKAGVRVLDKGARWLWHAPQIGAYIYGFTSTADISGHGGGTRLAFDSNTGELKLFDLPSGRNEANTFGNWLTALHMGRVFGLPYRIFVSLIGAMVTMLSVTGVVIWMKKRAGRMGRKARSRPLVITPAPAE